MTSEWGKTDGKENGAANVEYAGGTEMTSRPKGGHAKLGYCEGSWKAVEGRKTGDTQNPRGNKTKKRKKNHKEGNGKSGSKTARNPLQDVTGLVRHYFWNKEGETPRKERGG